MAGYWRFYCWGYNVLCRNVCTRFAEFNLAFVSIGVDYFQVLAMFRNADIRWPVYLIQLFNFLDFSILNIDIAAPSVYCLNLTTE